jgi:hypothetical protein
LQIDRIPERLATVETRVNEHRLFTPESRSESLERAANRRSDDQIVAFKVKTEEVELGRMAQISGRQVRRQEVHRETGTRSDTATGLKNRITVTPADVGWEHFHP